MGRHYQQGLVLFEMARYQDAIDAFTNELSESPGCAHTFAMRAASWLNNGRIRFAQRDVLEALRLAPDMGYAHYILSCVRSSQGRPVAAEAAARAAIQLDPRPEFFCRLAEIEYARGRFNECRRAVEEGLALDPCHAPSLVLRAKALAAVGLHEEARQCLNFVLAQNPNDPAAHHALGAATLQLGNAAEARDALREARRLNPVSHNDRDALAAAYGRLVWPVRVLDRYLLRFDAWSPAQRWTCIAILTTALIVVGYLLKPYPYLVAVLFVVAFNLMLAPLTLDLFAIPLGKFKFHKDLDLAWYRLLPESIRLVAAVVFHAIATILAIALSLTAELAMVFLCFVPNIELILVLIRKRASLTSVILALLAFFGVFIPAIVGATFLAVKPPVPVAALVSWAISLGVSYLLTVRWR